LSVKRGYQGPTKVHETRNFRGGCADEARMAGPLRPEDPSYPTTLFDLLQARLTPCPALYTRGSWPPRPGIAVVGTRQPTPEALDFTREVAAALIKAGWAVWSGGALGIDAAAHTAALDQGGSTVVVTPSGFDRPYPREHRELFARVVEAGGTLVSPFPETERPTFGGFHRRNAVLAALTLATVVVQAGFKSGARSTASAARKLRRPLYVVPHAPWDPKGQGCALELSAGARALALVDALVAGLERDHHAQVALPFDTTFAAPADRAMHAREHGRARDHAQDHAHETAGLTEEEERVLDAVGETLIHTDDLCERTALPFTVVTAALLTLTLQAVVVEAPAGFYRRSPP
jgi:DNA processing protein